MVHQLIFMLEATQARARWRVGRGKHGQVSVAHPVSALSPDLVEPAVTVLPQVFGSASHAGDVEPRSVHRRPCPGLVGNETTCGIADSLKWASRRHSYHTVKPFLQVT